MASPDQLDIFDDDPRRIAKREAIAWRAAADEALRQYQFSASVREERHKYYTAQAVRLEALANELQPQESR
ncbi:hypothetical protein [Stenotrophomonas sp. NPDC078853]|uniref:hypothetical protein n=1 Tax=Stenotrophomonas sp. NPDC078853 TaxID=3364534 RepID=UPI0038509DFE